MKKKEFIALERRLLPNFPGFAIKGSMMLIPPVEHTLRAFDFDAGRFGKKEFYLTVFFMPLCVPLKFVHFLFGHRIRPYGWNADEPNLETNVTLEMQREVPFLMSLTNPKEVAEAIKPRLGWNANCHEAFAYSLIQAGETDAALEAIDVLLKLVHGRGGWEGEVGSRMRLIQEKLLGNPDDAKRQLHAWEEETVHNLGLREQNGTGPIEGG